jgi:hypothetical protein
VPDDRAMNDPASKLLTRDGRTLFAANAGGRVYRSTDVGATLAASSGPVERAGFTPV